MKLHSFKTVYRRPSKVSRGTLLFVSILSIAGMALVQAVPQKPVDDLSLKLQAVRRAEIAMRTIKEERQRRKHSLDKRFDPLQTGLIGLPLSKVTSKPADLMAKQLSTNPNFAAVIVDLLSQAGVKKGDTIAIGWSGSFPALNISLAAAADAMELKPIVVASALSSQYGANMEDYAWLDMEKTLVDAEILRVRSQAVSIGGAGDRAMEMDDETKSCVATIAERVGVPMLDTPRRTIAVDRRMKLYQELAGDNKIKAYVNVGGGHCVTWRRSWQRNLSAWAQPIDCCRKRSTRLRHGSICWVWNARHSHKSSEKTCRTIRTRIGSTSRMDCWHRRAVSKSWFGASNGRYRSVCHFVLDVCVCIERPWTQSICIAIADGPRTSWSKAENRKRNLGNFTTNGVIVWLSRNP